ncbi:Clavesin-1, partial [Pseudolycoriella hygida]
MYHFTDIIKVFFMVSDIRLITPDENGLTDGEIPIFDMAGFSLRHLTKVVLSSLRCYMKYTQEAHPVRLKQIHVINCAPFLDRVLALLKPFMKNEVFKLIHFHAPGSDTLYKFVPLEMLPNEYGGKAGSIEVLKKDMMEKLNTY